MLSKRKWLIIFGLMTIVILLMTGCSDSKSTPETKVQDQTELKSESEQNKLKADNDLAKELEAEKGIGSVMVQVEEGEQPAVNVDIVIDDEQELSPDQIIDKYGKVIKGKYPDRTIDIIVAKDGKLLKQTTIK